MKELPQLPVGQQYFSSLRQNKELYIDKTRYIYEFCQRKTAFYFLSRPRRFGKSLTLDTIGELFEGNQTLFEGLWIADKWDWSQTYPVIRLSLDAIGHEKTLDIALQLTMHEIAESFEVELKRKTSGAMFKELIEKVARKRGKQVVILIDEYDRPIVDHIDRYNFQKAIEQRDTLKKIFDVLKNASKHIRYGRYARPCVSIPKSLIIKILERIHTSVCIYMVPPLKHPVLFELGIKEFKVIRP